MKLLLTVVCLLFSASWASADDPVALFGEDDPEMSAASAEARKELDRFLAFAETYSGEAALQVAFPTVSGEGYEHIWVIPFEEVEGGFKGILEGNPQDLGDLTIGSEVRFSRDQISDWGAVIDDRGYGYYTLRVLAPRLEEFKVKGLREWLSDEPLPPDWD
ncbi:DUF2314 domain-containing protein [Halovulum sp. GXIMD14793]